ncbi:MAG: S-layer homology domain-containing protein [Natronincolaceae bacterium]
MRIKRKFFSVLLVAIMVMSMLPIAAQALNTNETSEIPTFSDMPDDWSTAALEHAVENGLLQGADGKIMPNDKLTRAQMATLIVRAFGATKEGDIERYTDVGEGDWFRGYIAKAYQMKVIQGADNKMNPNDPITRQEVFVVIARALKLEPEKAFNKTFEDSGEIADWADGEIKALVNKGYIQGSDGKLNPKGQITRAEFAQAFYNIIKQYISAEGEYEQVADGNIMINAPGVTLKNVTVKGDLIIGEGVGEGEVTLEDVDITGRMVVRGGGKDSIVIKGNSKITVVILARADGTVSIKVQDGAEITEIIVEDSSEDVIIEGQVDKILIEAPNITVTASKAEIDTVEIYGKNSTIILDKDTTVKTVTVAEQAAGVKIQAEGKIDTVKVAAPGTKIIGTGKVSTVEVQKGANNTSIETPNTEITVDKEVTGVTGGGGDPISGGTTVSNDDKGGAVIEEKEKDIPDKDDEDDEGPSMSREERQSRDAFNEAAHGTTVILDGQDERVATVVYDKNRPYRVTVTVEKSDYESISGTGIFNDLTEAGVEKVYLRGSWIEIESGSADIFLEVAKNIVMGTPTTFNFRIKPENHVEFEQRFTVVIIMDV